MDMLGLGRPSSDPSDPHLSVQVEPLSSAFYAGELFQVRITFTNTRKPISKSASWSGKRIRSHKAGYSVDVGGGMPSSPKTAGAVAQATGWTQENATAGPSSPRRQGIVGSKKSVQKARLSIGSASGNMSPRGSRSGEGMDAMSPKDWARLKYDVTRSRSVDLDDGTMSPQEIVWSLEASQMPRMPSNPHRRHLQDQFSPINSNFSPTSSSRTPEPGTPASSQTALDQMFRDQSGMRLTRNGSADGSGVRSPESSSRRSSGTATPSSQPAHQRSMSGNIRSPPSYLNGYGADTLGIDIPSPILENPRSTPSSLAEPGSTTILWAHTRLVGYFTPSTAYIPPDPLLPLRSLLLHQPLGSGSLIGADQPVSSSRWNLSFGSGTIGKESAPSLTGSLFGLAKGIVWGGSAGTLEEERRKIWASKNLPVLDSVKSLIGIDIQLAAGESKSFIYTLPLPAHLPPTFRGAALRFGYDVSVSVNVALPGPGKKQRTREVTVPVKVWPHTALKASGRVYDVLQPIMQRQDEGLVEKHDSGDQTEQNLNRLHIMESAPGQQTLDSLKEYVRTLQGKAASEPFVEDDGRPSLLKLDATAPDLGVSSTGPARAKGALKRIESGEDLSASGRSCREAVEIISRIASKVSFDIRKDGSQVATLTLVKGVYRVGESILGVVDLNLPSSRRVVKFTAQLISEETIPEILLPPPESSTKVAEPNLTRVLAEAYQAVTIQTSRLSFSLEIPSDATPGFSVMAANDGHPGGVQWKVKLSFLVLQPRSSGKAASGSQSTERKHSDTTDIPVAEQDVDNEYIVAPGHLTSSRLNSDLLSNKPGQVTQPANRSGADTVECVVPVRVIAGNTSFLVKPSVFVI